MNVPTPIQTASGDYSVVVASQAPGVGVVSAKETMIDFDRAWGTAASPVLPGPAELLAALFGACIVNR